jgi:hypothetical protein
VVSDPSERQQHDKGGLGGKAAEEERIDEPVVSDRLGCGEFRSGKVLVLSDNGKSDLTVNGAHGKTSHS